MFDLCLCLMCDLGVFKLEEDALDLQKTISSLLKVMKTVKKIPASRRPNENFDAKDVQMLLQATQSIDHLVMEIQHSASRCTNNSFFLQRKLELRRSQL